MRFLETMLIVFAAIYLAQLLIAVLILTTIMLFLWGLWKRPREALALGLAVLAIVAITKPIGLMIVGGAGVVISGWWLVTWALASRRRPMHLPQPRLPPP